MNYKKRNALVPLPADGLENIGTGPKSILSGMVFDALTLARVREKAQAKARFRIGDYEFRDVDYRQILIWAKALEIEPEAFIDCIIKGFEKYKDYLEDHKYCFENSLGFLGLPISHFETGLKVEDGSIVSLVWDFDDFPISSFEWVDGLRIKELWFQGTTTIKISLCLPLLNYLDCSGIGLTELDLSNVSALTILNCRENKLGKLDLSKVPVLTELLCGNYPDSSPNFNELVELDLSQVPELTKLDCWCNRLVELDVSKVPRLSQLNCNDNLLAKLDLSTVPALTKLDCDSNQLVRLDLSNVPALTELNCYGNPLVELDLSNVPMLTKLYCGYDQLTELDFSKVPVLMELSCYSKNLTKLDIRGLKELNKFACDPSVTVKKLPTQNFKK